MKRVECRGQLPRNSQCDDEDFATAPHDKVTFEILGGTISFTVPPDVPDDEVMQEYMICRDAYCVLKLENNSELEVWLNEGPPTVTVRVPTAHLA